MPKIGQTVLRYKIVEKLRVQLAAGRPLVKRYTENVEAYNLYLKARYQLWKMTPEGLAKSKEYYDQAITVDRNYALAWSGLGEFYHLLGLFRTHAAENSQCPVQPGYAEGASAR